MTTATLPLSPSVDLSPDVQRRVPRGLVFAFLFFVFVAAYVLGPYWMLAHGTALRVLILLCTLAGGMLWAFWASGTMQWTARRGPRWGGLAAIIAIAAALAVINYRAMTMGVPWRGDEDFHISEVAMLVARLLGGSQPVLMAAALFVTVAYFFIAAQKPKISWLHLAGCVMLAALMSAWVASSNPVDMKHQHVIRYPFLPRWLAAAPVILASPFVRVHAPFSSLAAEPLYRMTPFLAAIALSWATYLRMNGRWIVSRALFALAIGTLPLVLFYTSILYLEMPALLMMTIAAFAGHKLLTDEPADVCTNPGWYALLLTGFLKETAVAFLAAFVLCRVTVRAAIIWKAPPAENRRPRLRRLADEFGGCICAVFPLALYVCYRKFYAAVYPIELGERRTFTPHLSQLFDPSIYRDLLRAYGQQFGLLSAAAIAGLIVMIRRRQYAWTLLLVTTFAAHMAMTVLDESFVAGYSRFNLFLLPSLIVAAAQAAGALATSAKTIANVAGMAVAIAIIASNFWLCPVNLDGSKQPGWGDYRFDLAEHYYPYREAIRYLNANHKGQYVIIAGGDYPSKLPQMYLSKNVKVDVVLRRWDRHGRGAPTDDVADLQAALANAAAKHADAVLYHLYGQSLMNPKETHGYAQKQVFANEAHTLVLYAVK